MTDPVRYYVEVYGPNTTGPLNTDPYKVERHADVSVDELGNLRIVTAAREAGVVDSRWPIKARGPETFVYPRGGWTKIRIGKVVVDNG